jgi:hypothetical protein
VSSIEKGDLIRLLYETAFPLNDFSSGKPICKGVFTVKAGAIGRVTHVWNTSPQKSYVVKFDGMKEPHNIGEVELEAANALDLINREEANDRATYRRSG